MQMVGLPSKRATFLTRASAIVCFGVACALLVNSLGSVTSAGELTQKPAGLPPAAIASR